MALSDMIRARGQAIVAECSAQLPIAADAFKAELLDVIGVQGTEDNPSKPGEAPHKVSGTMIRSVVSTPDSRLGVVYVGPTVPYAKHLLKTRPFYRITADRVRQRMRDLVFEPARKPSPIAPRPSLGRRIASFITGGRRK